MKTNLKNIKHTPRKNNKHKYRHNQELKENCDTALLRVGRENEMKMSYAHNYKVKK